MRHLSIAIVTPAILLASLVLSDFAGAADVTPPPPGYRPPPSSYDFPPDRGAPPRAYGLPSPSMDRLRPIDRKQTMGRHPSTARAAKALCITFIQNPVCRRAGAPQHVISSGGAVRGSADGSASATRESMPRPNHGYAPPQDPERLRSGLR